MNNKTKKILIIEDELNLLKAIEKKLKLEGYEVFASLDGEDGLKKIREEKPDLVLLDIILPKKNGFEVLENLKKTGNKIPVIIISNSGQPVEIDRALDLGIRDYLVKTDFTPADVLGKIVKVIGRSSSEAKPSLNRLSSISAGKSPAENNSLAATKRARVLIIEDDGFLGRLLVRKLDKEGLAADLAVDGKEGLKKITEERPDLLLLDLILPGLDGFQILKNLRENKTTAGLPVIVLSNLGQLEEINKAKALGADDFLIKANFTPTEVVSKIKNLLKGRKL